MSSKTSWLKGLVVLELFLITNIFYAFRCLFLPSLATVKGVSADSISTGGIGGGEKCCFVPITDQWFFFFLIL